MPTICIEDIYWPNRLILYNRRLELIEGDTASYPDFKGPRFYSGLDAIQLIRKIDDDSIDDYEPVDLYDMNASAHAYLILLDPKPDVDLPPIPDDTSDPAIIDDVFEKCRVWSAFVKTFRTYE
jgi:hypothetical protein